MYNGPGMSRHANSGMPMTMARSKSRNKEIRGKPKQHPSLETRLHDIEEVKKLNISEESFSYYADERKTVDKGFTRTLKPQFMYDAGAARQRDQERESRERYEAIRRRFWKKWAPNNDVRNPKVLAKGMTKLHPFNMALMRPTNHEEKAALKQSRAMYKESLTRAALDAIEFCSNVKTPTKRMQHLPKVINALKESIEVSENHPDNLFEQRSDTSSTVDVIQWIKHLNPYEGGEEKTNKRMSISSRLSDKRIKKSKTGNLVQRPCCLKEPSKDKSIGTQKIPSTHENREEVPPVEVSIKENSYSTISIEQLLGNSEPQPLPSGNVRKKQKVSGGKKARELNEEIEMVKNLIIPTLDKDSSKNTVSQFQQFQVDLTKVEHWQDRRLYYQKQEGIDYDKNYNHPCLQSLKSGPHIKGSFHKQKSVSQTRS